MFSLGRMARGRTIAPGGAIVRFLSRFGTLEKGLANDRPSGGRTFASSVCLALLRRLRRTIAQGWANVCFLSVLFPTVCESN
jgi:hypothetical protein